MPSEVGICNRALQKLGANRIVSLTEDSKNGRACNNAYFELRDSLYEDHDWNFTIRQANIAADAVAPSWGRARSFQLPSDFIRLSNDFPEDNLNTKDWIIQEKKIYTDDSDPLYIRYVARITDPNTMTPLFRELLATKIAYELCEELTQSNTKKELLATDLLNAERKAKKSNAFQKVAAEAPEVSWITSRS